MTVAAMLGAAGAAGVFIAFLCTPSDRRRGLAVALAAGVAFLATSVTARDPLPAAAPVVIGLLMLIGIMSGERRPTRAIVPLLLVLIVSALASIATTWLLFPAATGTLLRLSFMTIVTVVCLAGAGAADRQLLIGAVIALAVVEAALGLVEFFVTHRPVPWGFRVKRSGSVTMLRNTLLPGSSIRVSGSIGHPIPYAVTVATGMVFVVVGRTRAITKAIVLPLCTAALVFSGSRSVLLATSAALLFVFWTAAHRPLPVRVVVFALGAVLGVVLLGDTVGTATDRFLESGSYENRANSMAAIPGLLTRPLAEVLFGSGFGSGQQLFDSGYFVDLGLRVVDNQFVTSLATQGVVGAVLFVVALVLAWRRGDRLARAMVLLFATLTFSFDFANWASMLFLLSVAFAVPGGEDHVLRPDERDGRTPRPAAASRPRTPRGVPARVGLGVGVFELAESGRLNGSWRRAEVGSSRHPVSGPESV